MLKFLENIKRKDLFIYISLLLVVIIFSIFVLKEVYSIEYLFSYDPLFHLNASRYIDAIHPMATHYETYGGELNRLNYPSIMRLFTVILHELFDVSYIHIYKVLGLVFRILCVLAIFKTVKYISKNNVVALLCLILFLSSEYVFYRSLITYPENFVLIFHVLIFHDIVKIYRENKVPFTLPIYFAASLMIHYRSIVIPLFLITALIIYKIYKQLKHRNLKIKKLNYKKLIIYSLIFIILCFPVLNLVYKQYVSYFKLNIGDETKFATKIQEKNDSRYIPPSLNVYINNMGILLFLLTIASLYFLLKKPNFIKLTIFLWILVALILTQGTLFKIYVPSDRMFIYLIIPSVIASSYVIKFIIERMSNNIIYKSAFIVLFIFPFIFNLYNLHGWEGIRADEINACNWIKNNNLSNNDSVFIFSNVRSPQCGINFNRIESRKDVTLDLKSNNFSPDVLKKHYNDDKIYLISTMDEFPEIKHSDYNAIFNNNKIVIINFN